jgi:hypothetical protein
MALFKEIALEQEIDGCVIADHIDEKTGKACTKLIKMKDL